MLTIREQQERQEHEFLSEYAAFSDCSRGRDHDDRPCDIRTVYQRDRDRIVHSKAFRRLKSKTQVFLTPQGDHYRTRMTHTLEVSQIARTIAKALRLNEDLTEAIALGHDLGHTPFGHAGERALNSVCTGGFEHNVQSLRVVEKLEKRNGKPLNLTWEVRDGILNHQTKGAPATLEGKIVRLSDKIAYINHDIDDAIRGHIITEKDIPAEYKEILGNNLGERINTLIHDIVRCSEGKPDILMSPDVQEAMFGLRKYMFSNVYTNPTAKGQEIKAVQLVIELYNHYRENSNLLPEEYLENMRKEEAEIGELALEKTVCDYVAGMTDGYAINKYTEIKLPASWKLSET